MKALIHIAEFVGFCGLMAAAVIVPTLLHLIFA